jgi:molecular chaperone DnaK
MASQPAVGIDLGTTNSAAARIDDTGRTVMIRNSEGDLLTPSVVLFEDAEVVVGKTAQSATAVHPEAVAQWVKRDMGLAAYSRPIRGEYLPPEVIQACILRKLNADVVETLGSDASVVITVPAYFDEPRRKATADAGDMAGIDVLDIVNEPTAAALSFGETAGYLTGSGEIRQAMTVLVYDLGGGTFDVTLLKLAPGDVRTLATDGDVRLGGHDWDSRLVDYVADSFKEAHGLDPRDDPGALNRLYSLVVEAKHTLSVRTHASIRVEHGLETHDLDVTREKFEELTADLLERTSHTTRGLLKDARIDWPDISRILLVGGATRMPMVVRLLHDLSGLTPDRSVNPDEAVARGAAIYANYLLAKEEDDRPEPDFEVTNVNSHSLGVEGIEPETMRKTNVVLIPRNMPLPATFTEIFTTKRAGQQTIVVQVLEGESSLPEACTAIGRTIVRDLPPDLPQGWPIEITFEYGTNGRLHVTAVLPGKDRQVALDMERDGGLSGQRADQWKGAVEASSSEGFDAFESILDDVLGLEPEVESGGDPAERHVPTPAKVEENVEPPQPIEHSATFSVASADVPPPLASVPPTLASDSPVTEPEAAEPAPQAGAAPSDWQPESPEDDSDVSLHGSEERPAEADQPAALPQPGETIDFRPETASRRWSFRWLFFVLAYATSAIVGLGLGYLILRWLAPDRTLMLPW